MVLNSCREEKDGIPSHIRVSLLPGCSGPESVDPFLCFCWQLNTGSMMDSRRD